MTVEVKVGDQVVGVLTGFHAAVHPADGVHEVRSISPCDATTRVTIPVVNAAVYDPFAMPAAPSSENPNRAARRRKRRK